MTGFLFDSGTVNASGAQVPWYAVHVTANYLISKRSEKMVARH